ncbi:D-alanyl-D-alanine carboxypeptidase family protein [Rhabdochlamydiaceae symbiont of Dictyostelium giganteum]|uniref:D-alanyl-D-alanine carboxypeptidase family protein n=1 Tax=Rhabdochlamydiaceae symbiont of Dictyostelium giganteum TaxID=3342349 RepID=UPI00384AAB14
MSYFSLLFFVYCPALLLARPLQIELKAPSVILMNQETGAILYEKNSHEKRFPASITKVATALYVLEKKKNHLEDLFTCSKDALFVISEEEKKGGVKHPPYRLEISGSRVGLRAEEKLSCETLLYGLLLASGNDAANVLAENVSGSVMQFMKELNHFLKRHGICHTQFLNPHGLHHKEHFTTAYDMAKIAQLAYASPDFQNIVKSVKYLKSQEIGKEPIYFWQTNKLLRQGLYYYPKATGMKTGYTSQAGYTLVASAAHGERVLIAVLLGCEESKERFQEAKKLFEKAFSEKKITRKLFVKETDHFSYAVKGGKTLKASLQRDVSLSYYPAEEPSFQAEVVWEKLSLPIKAGDRVGFLRCIDEKGHVFAKEPLFAKESLSKGIDQIIKDLYLRHKYSVIFLMLMTVLTSMVMYFGKKSQKVSKR